MYDVGTGLAAGARDISPVNSAKRFICAGKEGSDAVTNHRA